jgi:ABC-type polysaccharide/polyol phosphate export permease
MLDQTGSVNLDRLETARDPVFQFDEAIADFRLGLARWRIWSALSWHEFNSIYHRTSLGVTWVIVSFAAFVFIKLAIFSSLLSSEVPGYYDSYLVLGFYAWFYMQTSVTAAPETFSSSAMWIKSEPLPFSLYVFKFVLRELYSLLFTASVVVAGIWYIGFPVTLSSISMSLLAIPVFVLTACAVKFFLGILSARFRDVSHLVRAIMLPMMFLTPIFWLPSQMSSLMDVLWWNPFFHYLEIFRAPLLDRTVPVESWIFVGVTLALISVSGFLLFARFRRRIVYWL